MDLMGHLDLLDRQAEFLRRVTDNRELLVAVPALLVQLYGDLAIRDLLAQLDADAGTAIASYKLIAESVTADLTRLAEDFAARSQTHQGEIDDVRVILDKLPEFRSGMLPLNPSEPFRLPLDDPLEILERVRLAQGGSSPFATTGSRLIPIYETHNHAERTLTLQVWTEASFSLARLRTVADLVNPKVEQAPDPNAYPRAVTLAGVIDRYVFGPPQANTVKADASVIGDLVARARLDSERLLLELRRRMSVQRSRLAVLRRFQTWAQWYARDELRSVIAGSGATRKRRQIEEDLTRELARFLFREGLDPLSQPLLGRVKPDLLDSSEHGRLYVEAKWVARSTDALDAIAQGVRQTLDSVTLLEGTAHRLDEAFVVLFLGDGPRVDAPAAGACQAR
jgi:hypothetical protein